MKYLRIAIEGTRTGRTIIEDHEVDDDCNERLAEEMAEASLQNYCSAGWELFDVRPMNWKP